MASFSWSNISQVKEFPLAHWLVGGADGERLFVRCFDAGMTVRKTSLATCWPR